jgi:hypothetical protein
MKAHSIAERINRVEELAHRARIFLELWTAMHLDTALEGFDMALDEFDDFWRFTMTAQETAFLIRITNLFVRDKRTANFISVIADAERDGAISAQLAAACRLKIDTLGDLPARVAIVRNNAMAHQHRTLKQNEAFSKAQISLELMKQYSDTAVELASMLKRGIGGEPMVVETNPAATLRELLTFVEARLQRERGAL